MELLEGALRDAEHPLRTPELFPVISRVTAGGVRCVAKVTVAQGEQPRPVQERLREILQGAAGQRQQHDELGACSGTPVEMSIKRLRVLERYHCSQGDLKVIASSSGAQTESELLRRMEGALTSAKVVLRATLQAIAERAASGSSACVQFRQHHAIRRLCSVMIRPWTEAVAVHHCFTAIAAMVSQDQGCRDAALNEATAPDLVATAARFPKDQRVQQAVCRVMMFLFVRAEELQLRGPRALLLGKTVEEACTARALECAFSAMQTFPGDTGIQKDSMRLLAALKGRLRTCGIAERALEAVCATMELHWGDADVVSETLSVVSSLGSSEFSVDAEVVSIVAGAMARHRSKRKVQQVGTKALLALSFRRGDDIGALRSGGAASAALLAMCGHGRDHQIQQIGTLVLEKLAPHSMSRIKQVCGEISSMLPELSWTEDPPPATGSVQLGPVLGDSGQESWRLGKDSKSAATPPDFGCADMYRKHCLREEIDAQEALWAAPKWSATGAKVFARRRTSQDALKRDLSKLREAGCDDSALRSAEPSKDQLSCICGLLREALGPSSCSAQDLEVVAGLLGHFAWLSAEWARQIVGAGSPQDLVACLRRLKLAAVKRATPEDDMVIPSLRACFSAFSCVCRHHFEHDVFAPFLKEELGEVELAIELARCDGSQELKWLKGSAMRCLARLMPHHTAPEQDFLSVVLPELESGQEAFVTEAACACTLEAAVNFWVPAEGLLAPSFYQPLLAGLQRPAVRGSPTLGLPMLLALEHMADRASESSARRRKSSGRQRSSEDEQASSYDSKVTAFHQQLEKIDVVALLMEWIPRAAAASASAVEVAAGGSAARALVSIIRWGAQLGQQELKVLLQHATSTESGPRVRSACVALLEQAIGKDDGPDSAEAVGQMIVWYLEELLPLGKQDLSEGCKVLADLASRIGPLLQRPGCPKDTVLELASRARRGVLEIGDVAFRGLQLRLDNVIYLLSKPASNHASPSPRPLHRQSEPAASRPGRDRGPPHLDQTLPKGGVPARRAGLTATVELPEQ
jgi:hypothetical protein